MDKMERCRERESERERGEREREGGEREKARERAKYGFIKIEGLKD